MWCATEACARVVFRYERGFLVDPLGRLQRIAWVDSKAGEHMLPVKGALGVHKSGFRREKLGR